MSPEFERRLKCLALYPDPPEGLEAAVARARAHIEPGRAVEALAGIERVCFAVEVGGLRRERAKLELEGGGALLPAAAFKTLMDKFAGPLDEPLRRFLLMRAYAALPASATWTLTELRVVTLRPPTRGMADAILAHSVAETLGAGLLAPRRVAERIAARGQPIGYGAIVRWVARTGAPVLPVDLACQSEAHASARLLRRRQDEIGGLIAQDLRIG